MSRFSIRWLRPFTLFSLLAVVPASIARSEAAPPSASRLFTASDFPRLARGITLPRDGQYTLRAWSTAKQTWTLTADDQTITLASEVKGDDARPRWQDVGVA